MILGDGHIRFGQKSKTILNPSNTDYEAIIEGNIHPLVPNHTYHRPVFKQGDTLSIEYRYDKDKYVQNEQPSAYYREPVTFEWTLKIDKDKGDYTITPHEEVKLSYNEHALNSENANELANSKQNPEIGSNQSLGKFLPFDGVGLFLRPK